ncbi:hypothetical protein QBC39DRAFT_350580 [Podospora conica]|nr:hypothetical protein QBC39DRAFT_350580 [Schizothecium conicum]
MEFALAFGAVGDFIALSVLIKDIIVSLDDCRGSSKAYQDLFQSLVNLDATLCEVDRIFRDPTRASIAQRLCATALDSLRQIEDTLQALNTKLKKFRHSLGPGGSGNRLKDAARKIQFKMDEQEINAVKGEIREYTTALGILLQTMALHTLDKNHDDVSKRLEGVATEAQSTRRELESTSRSLMTSFREIGHQVLGKIVFLTQTTLEIKTSAMQIASTVLSLSLELSNFRLLLLSLGRPPVEEYFTLEDALGRSLPIHLRTITSWEALAFVLSERFKGNPGARRVQQGRYRLLEHATRREISRSSDWKRSFSRYQRIEMSLLCKDSESSAADSTAVKTATCPWCKTDSYSDTSAQVQCRQCNMFFTRVVELDELKLPPKPSHPWERPLFGQPSFNVPIPPEILKRRRRCAGCGCSPKEMHDSKRRKCVTSTGKRRRDDNEDYESDKAEVHGLVRVTVVTRRKKIKVFQVPNYAKDITNDPTSFQVQKTHQNISLPPQANWTETSQYQACPHPPLELGKEGRQDGSSWLQDGGLGGVNDYSFLPYPALMAGKKTECSNPAISHANTDPRSPDPETDDEHFIFQGGPPLNNRYYNYTPFEAYDMRLPVTLDCAELDGAKRPVVLTLLDKSVPMHPEPLEVRILRAISDQQPDGAHGCAELVETFKDDVGLPCIVTRGYIRTLGYIFFEQRLRLPTFEEIQRIATHLFESVAFIHDLNIVHGNIKLENISLADDTDRQSTSCSTLDMPAPGEDPLILYSTFQLPPNVHVRLCGFGRADFTAPNTKPYFDAEKSEILCNSSSAPETLISRERGLPADIWGVGCALVGLVTGEDQLFGEASAFTFTLDVLAMMEKFCGGTVPLVLECTRQRISDKAKSLEELVPPGHNDCQDLFLDLLKRIFVLDPSKRITAREALTHPWFQQTPPTGAKLFPPVPRIPLRDLLMGPFPATWG